MYGTIARMRLKPGGFEAMEAMQNGSDGPPGPGAMCVFQMDADPNEIWLLAFAESERAYRAASESPEAQKTYAERSKWFAAEPEWNDGEVLVAQHASPPEGAKPYGSIAELRLKPGALEAVEGRIDSVGERPPGSVAVFALQTDADPNKVFLVGISESERDYRAFSESEESHERYLEMMKWLESEPVWHDGHVVDFALG